MVEFPCYKCLGIDGRLENCKICCGEKTLLYDSEEEYFNKLADTWEEETGHSSHTETGHPCYIAMRKIGKNAVRYTLKRLQKEKSWLLFLIPEIINSDEIYEESIAGYLNDLTNAWLEWGIKRNIIQKKNITIYSDGACSGNPGPGGFATIVDFGDERVIYKAGYKFTTNNRMELLGIIDALERIGGMADITIYTDSQYVVNAINKKWLENWVNKNWKTASKAPVKNKDLWQRLLNQLNFNNIKMVWIKGHNEHPENEECDRMAVAARTGSVLYTDFEYEKQREQEEQEQKEEQKQTV